MQEIVLPEELLVGEGYGTVQWAIRSIYEGYTGWFRHGSTTELYSYSPKTIFPELNDLIEEEKALKKIKDLINKNEYFKAIHLCEIIISADNNEKALKMYLKIHKILLVAFPSNSKPFVEYRQNFIGKSRIVDMAVDFIKCGFVRHRNL